MKAVERAIGRTKPSHSLIPFPEEARAPGIGRHITVQLSSGWVIGDAAHGCLIDNCGKPATADGAESAVPIPEDDPDIAIQHAANVAIGWFDDNEGEVGFAVMIEIGGSQAADRLHKRGKRPLAGEGAIAVVDINCE